MLKRILLGWSLFLASLFCATLSSPVFAWPSGFYAGAEIGSSKTNYEPADLSVNCLQLAAANLQFLNISCIRLSNLTLSSPTGFPQLTTAKSDDSGVGGRIFMGINFYKVFSVEAGYTRFNDTKIENILGIPHDNFATLLVSPPVGNVNFVEFVGTNLRIEQHAVDLVGKIMVPLMRHLRVFVKGGMAYVEADVPDKLVVNVNRSVLLPSMLPGLRAEVKVKTKKEDKLVPTYGIGFSYVYNSYWSIDATYSKFEGSSPIQKSELATIGTTLSIN